MEHTFYSRLSKENGKKCFDVFISSNAILHYIYLIVCSSTGYANSFICCLWNPERALEVISYLRCNINRNKSSLRIFIEKPQ